MEMDHKIMELEVYNHQTEFGKWQWGTILLISSSFILLSFSLPTPLPPLPGLFSDSFRLSVEVVFKHILNFYSQP